MLFGSRKKNVILHFLPFFFFVFLIPDTTIFFCGLLSDHLTTHLYPIVNFFVTKEYWNRIQQGQKNLKFSIIYFFSHYLDFVIVAHFDHRLDLMAYTPTPRRHGTHIHKHGRRQTDALTRHVPPSARGLQPSRDKGSSKRSELRAGKGERQSKGRKATAAISTPANWGVLCTAWHILWMTGGW